MSGYEEIIQFWFNEIPQEKWWEKDPKFDSLIAERFGEAHTKASLGECYPWRVSPHGRLAEIIVLDQFSRNMFRQSPKAFEYDLAVLFLSQEAIHNNTQDHLTDSQKAFLYMPFMHSESLCIQEKSLELFSQKGLEQNKDFAQRHHEIIKRFGRFPHRNTLLQRESTKEELEFLKQDNSSF